MASVGLYIQQIDFTKLFFSGIKTQNIWNYTNPTGTPITFTYGTVFGVIPGVAGTVRDTQSTSTDGSEVPYGVLMNTITVAGNATVAVILAVGGEINAAGILFSNGTDTLNTVVTVSAVVMGTMMSILTKGGIYPTVASYGDYADNG